MRTPARLGLYGGALVAAFAVAFTTAGAVVLEETVQSWMQETEGHDMQESEGHDMGGSENPEAGGTDAAAPLAVRGLSLAQGDYRLSQVDVGNTVGQEQRLSLTVLGPGGEPVTDFELSHDKELHLIVVRDDGAWFRHVHPERDAGGTWSIPLEWKAAGSYRVFADFVPTETGENVTVSRTVQVAGDFQPQPASETSTASTIGGFDVTLEGDLAAGETSTVTARVTRDGKPVTALEPYLGAYGHLVALRDGDLAYLHVHPEGDEPAPGTLSGPEVVFATSAPTPGRYLLYLDFQVGGQVHTAQFVVDAH